MLNTRDKPESSPCIGICSHATGDVVCRGCGRTLEEVRDWNTYTVEQKIAVKRRIKMQIHIAPRSDRRYLSNLSKPHIYWQDKMWKATMNNWTCVGLTPTAAYHNRMAWELVKK